MDRLTYRAFYERNLPHIQPTGATMFVTFRLAGSLPTTAIQSLKTESEEWTRKMLEAVDQEVRDTLAYEAQRRLFVDWDHALDTAQTGPRWLASPTIATIVAKAIHYFDGQRYDLLAFCVMPNHVHAVFTPKSDSSGQPYPVSRVLHSLKSYTAHQANRTLGREGAFWQHESYDHWARDDKEITRIIRYVCANPVRAGLVEHWQDWQWTYVRDMP
jgi:putative transposase